MLKRLLPALAALSLLMGGAQAQNYPNRPVTMIIPFAAGGPQDTIGRLVAARMSELLGQQIVIENVGGAGGQTGSKRVADAAPDGYTFVLASVGTHAQSQTLFKKPLINSVNDFAPVAFLGQTPIALIARADLPVNNFKEFIAYAKANQDKMQYGSAGAGSATHLGCVVLESALGTKMVHVPYRGTGPATQDLLAGRLDFLCEIIATGKAHIDGGKVKGIAIMTKERSPVLPNLPTTGEQGLDVQAYTWSALFVPKGTPADVIKKLNEAAVGTLNTPTVAQRLQQQLGVTLPKKEEQTPEWLGQFLVSEIKKWEAPIKASGASAD